MNFKHICFDLDGTLVESSKTIFQSTIATLNKLNIPYSFNKNDLDKMIGKHFVDIFNEFGVDVTDFELFINFYKSVYFDYIEGSILYAGVHQTLVSLKNSGIKISLLTTKAQDQADRIIDHFELRPYFSFVMGRTNDIPHKPSPEPLWIICDKLNENPADTLMVGDTEIDILCGKNAGAKSCAVSYGYRTEENLIEYKPDYIINELSGLIRITKNF